MTTHRVGTERPDAVATVAVALILVAVASSIRPVAVVPIAMFAAVVIADRIWTRAALARLTVELEARLTVVSSGDPVEVIAHIATALPVTSVQVGLNDRLATAAEGRAAFTIGPTAVGPIEMLDVSIRIVGIGITSLTRKRQIALREVLHCGPRLDDEIEGVDGSAPAGTSATRPYEPGDRPNRINWSATARTGTLLVRSAGHDDAELVVVVDSTNADIDDLDWLRRPASTVATWWSHHDGDVRLVTREREERSDASCLIDATVHDRDDLLRRLARVHPGTIDASAYPDAVWFAREEHTR